MQESSLHASLKDWYTQYGDLQEVEVEGFLVDVVKGNMLIEIQTRNFGALKNKLKKLLINHPVKLVYPIAQEKWIVTLPAHSHRLGLRRKSPKRGRAEDVFRELVRIPSFIANPNFSLELVFIQEEEIRRDDGKGSWRRKRMSIADRRLLSVFDTQTFHIQTDFLTMLPEDIELPFSNKCLAANLRISQALASKMTYCLRSMGVLTIVGKNGNTLLYTRS